MNSTLASGKQILTVSLEDYFQGAAFRKVLTRSHWSRFEQRVQQNTDRALALLRKHNQRATFFVSSWLAEQIPAVVKRVIAEGHEIGSAGSTQQSFRHLNAEQLRMEARESKAILEQLTGVRVRGFRVADHLLGPQDTWALRVLSEEGYDYDSSLSPSLNRFAAQPHRYFLHQESYSDRTFYELPLPAFHLFGLRIPIAGGNYFRQIPEPLLRRAINSWIRKGDSPFVFYFRIWDLDPDQPEITGAPRLAKLRHYRNARRIPDLLDRLLGERPMVGISEYLGLPAERITFAKKPDPVAQVVAEIPPVGAQLKELTILVPCYNENHSLAYMSRALAELQEAATKEYQFRYVFVDDGSTDDTWSMLQRLFGSNPRVTLLQHSVNQGITGAILTGARATSTELVCTLDCDCTYDPMDLRRLIPLLTSDVDCVTASPYHPEGKVLNVPRWRLFVSSGASSLYQLVLGSKIHTFTSCFRVYRTRRLLELTLHESGFVGMAEILGKLQLQGARIVECPATLTVRMLGHSKMKLLRNTFRHLRLLGSLARARYLASRRVPPSPPLIPVSRRKSLT